MRVILYTPDFTGVQSCGGVVTLALSEGLTKLGIPHDVRRTKHWPRDGREIADVCIVNGWWKRYIDGRATTNRNDVIKAQEAAGKPAWCIERAFVGDREAQSAMSIGGFAATGDFRADGMPPDRWEKLGITLLPWRQGGDYILVAAQVPWDAQVDNGDHLQWLEDTIHEIRRNTDRPIRLRGHPKAWRQPRPYRSLSHHALGRVTCEPLQHAPVRSFEDDMAGAAAVVCYNSNVATLASIAGVPVFTGAPSLADPVACRDLSLLEAHPRPDREQWAWDLAYKQWHTEEFREALPWLHLMR